MNPTAKAATNASALATVEHARSLGLVGNDALSVAMPFETEIVLFESIRIAGTTHAANIDDVMSRMTEGARLDLVREHDNQIDQWAIRVEYGGKKIGYVPADRNELVARLMDGGKTVRGKLTECELRGNWWKVFMEVTLVD